VPSKGAPAAIVTKQSGGEGSAARSRGDAGSTQAPNRQPACKNSSRARLRNGRLRSGRPHQHGLRDHDGRLPLIVMRRPEWVWPIWVPRWCLRVRRLNSGVRRRETEKWGWGMNLTGANRTDFVTAQRHRLVSGGAERPMMIRTKSSMTILLITLAYH
jgi:hypothetical protein